MLRDYKIRGQRHAGSSVVLYTGNRISDGRKVIIKTQAGIQPPELELSRLRHEYKLSALVDSPYTGKVLELLNFEHRLALVEEDFGGISLKEYLSQNTLELKEKFYIATQMARGLADIHNAQIIHRNLSSLNLLINPETRKIRWVNFRHATQLREESSHLLNPGSTRGSLPYISPEQTGRMNRRVDYRSDFYSLGVVYYELFCGTLPFQTEDPLDMIYSHLAKSPIPPQLVDADLPPALSDIIMKLMMKNSEDRYQSANGLIYDLDQVRRIKPGSPTEEKIFATGREDFSSELLIPDKLYGRQKEQELLEKHFQAASEGTCRFLLIAGYSGIGKSALVQSLHKSILRKKGFFISGKYDQYQKDIPYFAVSTALIELCDILLTETEEKLNYYRKRILEAVGGNGQVLIEYIPNLVHLIGAQNPINELGPRESQVRFNNVFRNFLKALARTEHPLFIFMDDLQWADNASLELLKHIISDKSNKHFLIVGAYRDNETSPTHRLTLFREKIQKADVLQEEFKLKELRPQDLQTLIAESLYSSPETIQPLADLIYSKTLGNAFFSIQLLKSLHADGLLKFDVNLREWLWDIRGIENRNISDNVVEVMVERLQNLPELSNKLLSFASCIGGVFQLELTARIADISPRKCLEALWPALEEGLIIPIRGTDEILPLIKEEDHDITVDCWFRFLHDRVQQAAYTQLEAKATPRIHHQIGQLIRKGTPPEDINLRIFDIVNQLNQGPEFTKNREERLSIARLNLKAARKAKLSAAYTSATEYIESGLLLLPENIWTEKHDFALEYHLETAELNNLEGNLKRFEELLIILEQHCRSAEEQLLIYNLKLNRLSHESKYSEALELGVSALRLLEIKTPDPTDGPGLRAAFEEEVLVYRELLKGRNIAELYELPLSQEPIISAAHKVIANISDPAILTNHDLFAFISIKGVNLSLANGNTKYSSLLYILLGIVFISLYQNYNESYELGQLGMRLGEEKIPFNWIQGRNVAYVLWNINHWAANAWTSSKLAEKTYRLSAEASDLLYGGYGLVGLPTNDFFCGEKLQETVNAADKAISYARKNGQHFIAAFTEPIRAAALNLMSEKSVFPDLDHETFSEDNYEATWREIPIALAHMQIYKSQLCYYNGEFLRAIEYSENIAENFPPAYVQNIGFYWYRGLALAASARNATIKERRTALEKIKPILSYLSKCAASSPDNCQHKLRLLEAEIQRLREPNLGLIKKYDQAAREAEEAGFSHNEALAYELAAEFCIEQEKADFAELYLKKAFYLYERWGAEAKTAQLRRKFSSINKQLETKIEKNITGENERSGSEAELDLSAVTRVARTISGELDFDKLPSKICEIALKGTGAEKAVLLLVQGQTPQITAAAFSSEISSRSPASTGMSIPDAVSNYVLRSGEKLILEHARFHDLFSADPYIRENQIESVLCVPIQIRAETIGCLYLENQRVHNAFSPARVRLLNILASQAAIALKNAQIHEDLKSEVQERRQAENLARISESALRESEAKWRSMTENATDHILLMDLHGKILFTNHAGPSLSEEETLGLSVFKFIPPEYLESARQAYESVRETGEPSFYESDTIDQNGIRHYYETRIGPVFEGDTVIKFTSSTTDITTRKIAEEELRVHRDHLEELVGQRTQEMKFLNQKLKLDIIERELTEKALSKSEKSYRRLVEGLGASYVIYSHSPDGIIDYLSPSANAFFGKHAQDMLGKSRQALLNLNGEELKYSNISIALCLEGKTPPPYEFSFSHPNGRKATVEVNDRPIFTDDGKKVIGIEGIAKDISKHKEIEESLRQNKQTLQTVIENLPSVVFVKDTRGKYKLVNNSFKDITGFEGMDVIGLTDHAVYNTEKADRVRESDESLFKTGRGQTLEETISLPNGENRVYLTSKVPLFNEKGEATGLVGISTDITLQKQVETELRKAREIAEIATQAKSEFLAKMSHEIRTPMNAIIGLTRMSLNTDLTPTQESYLLKISHSAANLLDIINDILDFSKIEAGKMEMEEIEFDLNQIIDQVIALTAYKAHEKGLEFLVEQDANIPERMKGDPLRLQQVLLNLISNAVKFTDKGETLLQIEVLMDDAGALVLGFTVRDTGIGIPEHLQENLFEAFSQAESSTTRNFGGTGLGLTICRRLVELMGGQIAVSSKPGQGSEFSFTAGFRRIKGIESSYPTELYKGYRALIIDPEKGARHSLRNILRVQGIESTEADSGSQALEIIKETRNKFNFIFINREQKQYDGIELAQKLSSLYREKYDFAFLVATTLWNQEDRVRADVTGFNGFLTKPITGLLLLEALHKINKSSETPDNNQVRGHNWWNDGRFAATKILLVEDNEINQLVARELLEESMIQVQVAANGEEALHILEKENFSLVLMDIEMPIMDGYEAARRIRSQERFRQLPIIAMTAHAMAEAKHKSLSAGMNEHITKPINADEFYKTLARHLPVNHSEPKPVYQVAPENSTPLPAQLPGLDTQRGLATTGGSLKLYLRFCRSFLEHYKSFAQDVERLRAQAENKKILQLIHDLKGTAGNLGARKLYNTAMELESRLKADQHPDEEGIFETLFSEMEEVFNSIRSLKKSRKKEPDKEETENNSKDSESYLDSLFKFVGNKILSNEYIDPRTLDTLHDYFRETPLEADVIRMEDSLDHIEYEQARLHFNRLQLAVKRSAR